jgi:hypothetical protein
VRLIVEPLDGDADVRDRAAALRRLRAGIEEMKFFSGERLPSRDELHDRWPDIAGAKNGPKN